MSSILAMTEDAQRRVERSYKRCGSVARRPSLNILENIDAEMLLLITVMLILIYSNANPMLLLAILYVTL